MRHDPFPVTSSRVPCLPFPLFIRSSHPRRATLTATYPVLLPLRSALVGTHAHQRHVTRIPSRITVRLCPSTQGLMSLFLVLAYTAHESGPRPPFQPHSLAGSQFLAHSTRHHGESLTRATWCSPPLLFVWQSPTHSSNLS